MSSKKIKHFLDYPEVKQYFENVFPVIIGGTDREAVLVAASQVDIFLEKALNEIAPQEISKKKLKDIFQFSGPLGTFSSRISMAYFFRIISKDVFLAINILRTLRNKVAHELLTFSLAQHEDCISNLYKLGKGVPNTVHEWAVDELMREAVNHALELKNPALQTDEPIFKKAEEVMNYISQDADMINILSDKLPRWKLGLGIALICGIIFHGTDSACLVLGDDLTFSVTTQPPNADSVETGTTTYCAFGAKRGRFFPSQMVLFLPESLVLRKQNTICCGWHVYTGRYLVAE
jgi:DNA-binding MltR family transcriptional regulator